MTQNTEILKFYMPRFSQTIYFAWRSVTVNWNS